MPPAHEHAPALSQVLATGVLVDMLVALDTLVQPAVQPAVPPTAAPSSGAGAFAVKQQKKQRRKAARAASTIAAAARARPARIRLQNLRQAVTAITATRRAIVTRSRIAAYRRASEQQRLGQHVEERVVIPLDAYPTDDAVAFVSDDEAVGMIRYHRSGSQATFW